MDRTPTGQYKCIVLFWLVKSKDSRNACYHSVQDLSSSSLLSKNLKINIYRTIILPVVFMGVKFGH